MNNLSRQKSAWKALLLIAALLIAGASLWYSNRLARDIAEREKREAELWANAYKNILSGNDENINFEFEVIRRNESVPLVLTDGDGNILQIRNIDTTRAKGEEYIRKRMRDMQSKAAPIEIEFDAGMKNYIYYDESTLIKRLKYYPFVQLSIIAAFLAFAYVLFSTARASEQNQLWVGMAKETAHQLGTPISSLSAWVELLKEKKSADTEVHETLDEIQKDIDRLELVAERFSKIGSSPDLKEENLTSILAKMLDYIGKRASDKVRLDLQADKDLKVKLNAPLFEWVIENLLKNALDAMTGAGTIQMKAFVENGKVIIEVKDSGKGIPKSKFNTVFEPGYSTKKRGWGLGLALSKRIIGQYHNGKIFVKESSDKGTVFRIVLPHEPGN